MSHIQPRKLIPLFYPHFHVFYIILGPGHHSVIFIFYLAPSAFWNFLLDTIKNIYGTPCYNFDVLAWYIYTHILQMISRTSYQFYNLFIWSSPSIFWSCLVSNWRSQHVNVCHFHMELVKLCHFHMEVD